MLLAHNHALRLFDTLYILWLQFFFCSIISLLLYGLFFTSKRKNNKKMYAVAARECLKTIATPFSVFLFFPLLSTANESTNERKTLHCCVYSEKKQVKGIIIIILYIYIILFYYIFLLAIHTNNALKTIRFVLIIITIVGRVTIWSFFILIIRI